jgi:hypothetical protein
MRPTASGPIVLKVFIQSPIFSEKQFATALIQFDISRFGEVWS